MKKWFCVAVLLIVSCGRHEAAAPQHAKSSTATSKTAATAAGDVGTPMPAYTAKWLDGSTFDLASQKGSVVLLNIWATWCGPCRFEIPELDKLHHTYESRGFKVIGVSVDEGGAADVKNFLVHQTISYPIALDPEGKLATMIDTTVIPTSILVDRRGKIVWKHFGIVSTSDPLLTRALQSALDEKS